ncbi:MAG: transglutaminase domain-containing protein [Candidatus Acidiferrum sp.]
MKLQVENHLLFRTVWRAANLFLAAAVVCSLYAGVREYSLRQYLRGFSDAVVPESATAEKKLETILAWMKDGPSRYVAADPAKLSARDPKTTLNYEQLLSVCGTATNAFLNLARSGGLRVRRLLLLTPEHNTKHVVAEVLVDGRWIIVDPAYRVMLRDASGQLLTRDELRNPAVFAEATGAVPGYLSEYNYDHYAHVRMARLPFNGFGLRWALNVAIPQWDEAMDWSLLLERESFLLLIASAILTLFFLLLRELLAWYADSRLRIPRFHLREHVIRAGVAFFSTPEIKQ